jgi:D-serine deaminase-like pyridoxal phosphate-dependent protein
VHGIDGATVVSLNDEHATIALPAGAQVTIGDRVRLRPSHVDPTINLHDVFYALEGEHVLDVWPISARGYAEHRGYAAQRG